MGDTGKSSYFSRIADANPARRSGTPDEVAAAVLFAMTNQFITGTKLQVDDGQPLT